MTVGRPRPRRDRKHFSDAQIVVRCTVAEKKRWKECAHLGRKTLSDLVRAAIEDYLEPELPLGQLRSSVS